ncbi:unnamed protein product [Paramecium pentaurelia]|uniref:AMP-dependent synthetase/ligase domain-containing protein n=1 Tax=Paramecium pentaurelia TaxID=43138 RepID=A0A8S1RXI9_9CILI|nr:unnamed protein product [Paramecium pentaurelia]
MGQGQTKFYAVPIGEKKEGESHIYRNPNNTEKLLDNFEGETTVQGIFLRSCRKFPNNKCLGKQVVTGQNSRHYVYKTYIEVRDVAEQLGSGIKNLNLIPNPVVYEGQELRMIGIFSKNREEWLLLDIANTLYGNTMIPLYDTLGLESIPYILEHTQMSTLFISNSIVDTLLKVKEYHALKNVVTFDELSQEIVQKFGEKGIKVLNYEEVLNAGKEKIHPFAEVHGKDIFTFSYTSGTTGMPKGVMLRHLNFVTVAGGVVYQGIQLYPTDVYLSYLPLPHVLERVVVTALLGFGCTICMYGGDVQKINVDIQLVKPTIFVSVPRLYRRLYNAIKEKADKVTGYQKTLFEKGLASKMYYLQNGGHVQHKVWDNLVFKKTREAFGGRVRLMLSGSAPMSPEVVDFLKCVVCVPFLEGYGQTEGCGGSFISRADDPISGHVGGVFSNIEFKVVDVPQMNYFSTDKDEQGRLTPRGEICIRGNGLFAGYYKEPEKTKEMIDADGWMHSGDIGLIRPDGSLKIIDRVKNIFKLSQGEYIAPEKVEGVYLKVKGIAEVFVYGDSTKSFCVGILVPEKPFVLDLANTLGIQGTFEELCANDKVNKYFIDEMVKYGKTEKLNGMENVKKIYIEPTSFIAHGLTSNTLKLMRHKAKEHFLKQIEAMYQGSE